MAGGKIDILVNPDVKEFPAKLEGGLRGSVATAGKIGSAIGAALGGAATIKGIATLGVEFDKQMNTMAAVSQATAPELATVEQHARDLGKSADLTATSASDAAAAMTELVKGGFSVSEAMDAAKGTLQLASAAQIDAAEAATIQSQALQSFGLDADYAATASDVLAGAANASSAEIEGISNGLQQSGAVANQFGLSMEDNATALAMFANAGIQGSDAGTLLKTALLSMTKDSKPAVEAIEALGLSIYDTNGEFVGMESLFGQLETASKSMTPEMYQSATAALFGSDAMRLAGVAAEQGAEGWNTTYDAVTRAGQASEVAAAQAQGIPGVMEAIENQAEDTGIAVYDAFSGLALEGGSALVGMLEEAGPRIESAASNIASGIEAALPTVERVVDVVGTGVSQIGDGLRVLGGAGVDLLTGIASTLAPAADATLSLTENLGGMTGPLMAAGTALAVGKWQNWGSTVERSGKKFTGFLDDVEGNQDFFRRMGGDVSYLTATWVTLEDRIPVIKRMGDAYQDAAAPMRTFSSRQRDLAASSDEAARATTSFWEHFDHTTSRITRNTMARGADWIGSVRGTFAAGVEAAKTAGRGIVDALGGGWNLAIAGATMAVTGITSAIQRTRDSERLLRELENAAADTGDALYEAFARGGTEDRIEALNDSLQSLLQKQQELADTAPGFWGGVTNAAKGYLADLAFWSDETAAQIGDQFHAQKQAAEDAKQAMEVLEGIDLDKAAHAISGTRQEYDRFIDSLELVGEEGDATRAELDRLRAEFVKMEELAGRLAPGAVEIADAFAVIADEASTAEEKTDALGSALDTILGIEPTADEAIAGLHEEIDEIADSAQKAAEAGEVMTLAFTAEGGLDLANDNSRALREELLGMRDSLETVAATGQDVDVAYAAQGGALEDLAAKYGTTTDKVRDLYGEMGGQPDLIETVISVNTNPATAGLGELWAQIEAGQVKAGEPVNIMVQNEDAVDALRGVASEVKVLNDDFENGNGQLEVTLDSDEAIEAVERFVRRVAELDDLEVSPEILLDDTQLKESAESAQEILDALDIQNPSPEAEFIIDKLLAGVDISQGELDFLASQSPTPVADLNKWLLEHGVQVSHEMLDAIDGKTVEAIITASESGVYAAVQSALTDLGRLPPEVAIPIVATHQQVTQQIGMPGFNAEGSVRYAANGLLSQQDPQIARGGDWLVWAEDETEGESFIPHAPSKRGRATQILAETAGIFGLGVVDAAGNPIVRDGSNLDQKDPTHLADGATRRAGATSAGDSGVIDAGAVPAGGSDALSLVDTIGGAIEGLPDEKVTTVTVEAAGVGEELAAISEQLAPLDEGETITVDAVGEPAIAVLDAVGVKATQLPDGSVEITASDDAAVASLDGVSGMLVELGDTEVSPVALLDTDDLEVSADDAHRLVEDLDIQEPTPTAQIIIDDLLAGKGIAQGELDFLGAMSPTPQADLNHALLDQGVQFSEGELQRVGNSKATSVVDAHNQSALTNIDNVMAALNNMPVERVIKIVAAGSAASALQGRASGGRIPRHASGGRLPTTGPGTDGTDRILGVGSDGVPTSWVDAGEWVVNRRRSDRFDRTISAINAGSDADIMAALRAEMPSLQALAGGGKVGVVSPDQLLAFAGGQNVMDQQAARSLQGALYDWGGVNWGDCSGAMSGLARFATGLAAFGGRFATGNQAEALSAMGFISGLGPSATSFNLGWFNGGPWGGHTAGDIAGTAVEMGGGAGGQGKIGGAAAHASHPQFTNHAHIPLGELWAFDYFNPLPRVTASYQPAPGPDYQTEGGQGVGPGGMGVQIAQGMGGGVDYTSTEGVHLKSGAVVPWNTAGLYDTGGLWPSGTIGVNLSGRNERVLTGAQNDIYEGAMDGFPALVSAMEAASGKLGGAAYELERAAMGLETTGDHLEYFLGRGPASQLMGTVNVSNFGGEWVRETEVVKEAEADLADVRSTIVSELEDISTAEDDLAAAHARLAEARTSSGEVSVSVSRKIEDAEQDVAKARADGDAEKIADAEQKLARAREDAAQDLSEAEEKQAEEIQKALEDVEKAESGLTEARVVAEDQAQRLEAAERAVIGARFEAVADLANQAGEALSTAFSGVSDLFGVLADQARIMEETEQRLAAERVQRQTAELELQRAALNTIIAEQDIARTRAMGAISVADAEAALEAARGAAALKGQTGIDAMSQALDRARATGEFAVEDIAQSVIDNAAEVRAAQHAVDQARAQAALDELTSVHTHRMAVLDLAQATLTQQQAVALVDISTRQLAAQAAQLGGLTSQGAQRASSGWGGLAQAGGGLGKLVGGLLGGAAGFAVGGIPGALLGGGAGVVSGLFDILSGGRQAWKNREEISDSWQGMDTIDKIITGGGLLLGGGAAIGGAYASNEYGYGPEFAGMAAELGAQIAAQSAGYAAGAITSDLDRINSLADEERSLLQLQLLQEQARIDQARMQAEMDYLKQSTALQSDVEIAELLGRIAQADTTEQADALADAAIVAAERRDQMIDIMSRQVDIAESLKNRPRQSINVQIPADGYLPASTFESFIDTMARIQDEVEITKDSISGADYLAART